MLRSSLKDSAIGLSIAELRRSSSADKQWLGISEEQLTNEIFTDKFYHLLHDPNDIWYSEEDVDASPIFNEKQEPPKFTPEEIFSDYLMNNSGLLQSTILNILQEISKVKKKPQYFY